MIACLDVAYRNGDGCAGCVLLESFTSALPLATHVALVRGVLPYLPGRFYLRELPCLLAALNEVHLPDIVVIDGYVWVSSARHPGLGAQLNAAIDRPVIGVAKTEFMALRGSPLVELVHRGTSKRPLFVTSVSIEPVEAGALIGSMHGQHRIPDALRLADRVARAGMR